MRRCEALLGIAVPGGAIIAWARQGILTRKKDGEPEMKRFEQSMWAGLAVVLIWGGMIISFLMEAAR